MGSGAALAFRPAGGPGGDQRGAQPDGAVLDGASLGRVLAGLRGVSATAAADAALFGVGEAAEFAARVEEISRTVEYLQLIGAAAVERTRTQAATTNDPVLDDGYRRAGDFLRARLHISAAEAHRRLALAGTVLPRTGTTGQPLAPRHEELGAALATGTLNSRSATIISQALDRVRPFTDPGTSTRMEHALTATATEYDPDFLTRIARRWTDALDQDGTEPSEEVLRQLQGAFIRRPRHGLHHLEIFATTDQFEHLLTLMNTATNPRTPHTGTPDGTAQGAEPQDSADATNSAGTADSAAAHDLGRPNSDDIADGVAGAGLDRRSRPQKLLDGLITGCKLALANGGLPATGGHRPQIMVTINYQDLYNHLTTNGAGIGASGTGAMVFTGPVTASTIRKIACDADIIPVLLGTTGRILDIGRTSRIFPPHIRKAITARDHGCTFPGCTIPAPWCEAHHITYWSHGGTTSTDNGTLLCSHHHHLIHKEQWTIHNHNGTPWYTPPPHLDPTQQPRRNRHFRP